MCIFAVSKIFIKAKSLKRKLKIIVYQQIADYFIAALELIPKDDIQTFQKVLETAVGFDEYCVDKEIYLN